MVRVRVGREGHEQQAAAGQHHEAAGLVSLTQQLPQLLVVDLHTGPAVGSPDLRDVHQHELPLRHPHLVGPPVLQLQVEVNVELEGSGVGGARRGMSEYESR